MNKTIFLFIIIFLSFTGCKKKDITDKTIEIEIYLPKVRIQSNDGIELKHEWNLGVTSEKDSSWVNLNKIHSTYARQDRQSGNIIYAGSFVANEQDLSKKPFIRHNEIIGFNFETSEIIFTASGMKKLWELKPNYAYSRQFVITANRKPILTGYFYNALSSSYVKHYYITYRGGYDGVVKPKFKSENLRIEFNPKSEYNFNLEKYDFRLKTDFYESFIRCDKALL